MPSTLTGKVAKLTLNFILKPCSLSVCFSCVIWLFKLSCFKSLTALRTSLKEQGFKIKFNVNLATLPVKVEGIASLIIKESVTNLLRHSSTKNGSINIEQTKQQLVINVIDNAPCTTLKAGNGLNGIKERAEQLNGNATFTCGDTFTLTVVLPLSAEDLK